MQGGALAYILWEVKPLKKYPSFATAGAGLTMLILILDSKTALESAQAGMHLLMTAVIPALFPFFFFTILLNASADSGSFPFLRGLTKLCKLPKEADGLWIPAFLGGYPSGAQAVCQLWKQNQISKDTAQHLLAFCNNAGPSFLFGILSPLFPKLWMVWALWAIHIGGAIFASFLFSDDQKEIAPSEGKQPLSLSQVLTMAISVMACVCGWILLFRIGIGFLNRWILWCLPIPWQVLTAGLLELTNGCCQLAQIEDLSVRFLLCSGMLAMGGVCVTLQTLSVTKGLSLRYYVSGKLCQTLFSVCVSGAFLYRNPIFLLPLLGLTAYRLWIREKSSSIPGLYGV